jgi:hypothetical protein
LLPTAFSPPPGDARPPSCSAEVLGIHGSPLRSLPIFLVYLATLRHHYSLATRHAARQAAAAADAAGPADLEAGAAAPSGGAAGSRAALRRAGSGQYLGETLGSTVSGVLQRVGMAFLRGSTSGEWMGDVCVQLCVCVFCGGHATAGRLPLDKALLESVH